MQSWWGWSRYIALQYSELENHCTVFAKNTSTQYYAHAHVCVGVAVHRGKRCGTGERKERTRENQGENTMVVCLCLCSGCDLSVFIRVWLQFPFSVFFLFSCLVRFCPLYFLAVMTWVHPFLVTATLIRNVPQMPWVLSRAKACLTLF